jgi:hypothetical protein
MKVLNQNEHELIGQLQSGPGGIQGDPICDRIEWLTTSVLERVAVSPSGWETLYRDGADGRFWERTYRQSYMHGGGPPSLIEISPSAAADKYKIKLEES